MTHEEARERLLANAAEPWNDPWDAEALSMGAAALECEAQQAEAIERVIAESSVRGGWVVGPKELQMRLRAALSGERKGEDDGD
jgi:hypothetical protein